MDPMTAAVCTPYPPSGPDGTPLAFPAEWLTEPVRALAHGIRADAAFDRMPILADALEEAGCDDLRVLNHCRFCQHHRLDCWVIETILPSDQLHWTGGRQERHAEAVAAAVRQGHPDDPDVIPGRELTRGKVEDPEADARQERRDQMAARAVWGCAVVAAVIIVLGMGILSNLLRQ